MELNGIAIFVRWLHIVTACLLVGSVFYVCLILPLGIRGLEPDQQSLVHLRGRRGFKMTVHVSLLLFLISGIYNAMHAWHWYKANPPVMHALFGTHLLLGLGSIALLMFVLAGREIRRSHPALTRWALSGLILAIAAASTLKSAREWVMTHPATIQTASH